MKQGRSERSEAPLAFTPWGLAPQDALGQQGREKYLPFNCHASLREAEVLAVYFLPSRPLAFLLF
jgi:hypothetical protein